jgi:molecular chaperone DnaJ
VSDHYQVLGLTKDASTEDVKKAYRKLARQLHPDVNPDAGERFKEVSAAYETLSNPDKRRAYDLGGGSNGFGGAGGSAAGFGFQDIFETFFGGSPQQRGPATRAQPGQDALIRLEVDLAEAVFGAQKEIAIDTAVVCPTCDGSCAQPGSHPATCDVCHGRGSVQRTARSILGNVMTSTPCPSCGGYGTVIPRPCQECAGEGRVRERRQLTIKVPAGVDTGTRIQLAGQSEVGPAGGPPGDLYVEVVQRQHETLTRRGEDLHCSVALPMTAAALGTTISLATLDGDRELEVKPGTQPGEVVTMRGLGATRLRSGGRGDLHAHIDVQVPTRLDERQRELLVQLARARGEESPLGKVSPAQHGVFGRLKDRFAGR